jgi:hypothetical protein
MNTAEKNIRWLVNIFTGLPMVQFIPVTVNREKTLFFAFERMAAVCYHASLLGDAYNR